MVDVGSCTMVGELRVPAGVTLRGSGAHLTSEADVSAVVLETVLPSLGPPLIASTGRIVVYEKKLYA